jgi:hypothetical protein
MEENGSPGNFHDTELIQTDLEEAEAVMEAEGIAIGFIDAHAATAVEFDELADQVEFEFPDLPSDDAPAFMRDAAWNGVNGLELGVAGLTYALNAVGIVTAASCRSHAAAHRRWAEYPVVMFAANEYQLRRLQPLVQSSGCGFELDEDNRPELVSVYGPSVVEMMALARLVLDQGNIAAHERTA